MAGTHLFPIFASYRTSSVASQLSIELILRFEKAADNLVWVMDVGDMSVFRRTDSAIDNTYREQRS